MKTLFFCSLAMIAAVSAQKPADGNPFMEPTENDKRSPCPAINTIANHGLIFRNGTAVPTADLAAALSSVYPVVASFPIGPIEAAREANLLYEIDGVEVIDLDALFTHNALEHDSSFVRPDVYFGEEEAKDPSADLLADFLKLDEEGDVLTKDEVILHQQARIIHSRTNNPTVTYNEVGRGGMASQGALMIAFGQDPTFETVPKATLQSFLRDETFPADYDISNHPSELIDFDDPNRVGTEVGEEFLVRANEARSQDLDDENGEDEAGTEDGGSGGGGGSGCLSADGTVQVQSRGDVAIRDLVIGDKVLVAEGKYEQLYAFGHHNSSERARFVRINSSSSMHGNEPLELTGDHLLYVEKASKWVPLRADEVKIGDKISTGSATQSSYKVTQVSSTMKGGLYMPLTKSGNIIVNGILVSTYVSIVEDAPHVVHNPLIHGWLSEDNMLHLWLTPYRMYCMGVLSNGCSLPNGANGILKYLLWGRGLAQFGNEQSFAVQFLMAIPLLVMYGSLYAVENFVGPLMAPLVIFLAASMAFRYSKKKID